MWTSSSSNDLHSRVGRRKRDAHAVARRPGLQRGAASRGDAARFVAWLRDAPFTSELVIVDDGSVDGTAALAAQLLPAGMGRVLREPHRGKGGAVRAGMLAAQGRYRLFMDVDLATPLEFVMRCLSRLQDGRTSSSAPSRRGRRDRAAPGAVARVPRPGILPAVADDQRRPSLGLHLWLQGFFRRSGHGHLLPPAGR